MVLLYKEVQLQFLFESEPLRVHRFIHLSGLGIHLLQLGVVGHEELLQRILVKCPCLGVDTYGSLRQSRVRSFVNDILEFSVSDDETKLLSLLVH